jgi:hypothetical protein
MLREIAQHVPAKDAEVLRKQAAISNRARRRAKTIANRQHRSLLPQVADLDNGDH